MDVTFKFKYYSQTFNFDIWITNFVLNVTLIHKVNVLPIFLSLLLVSKGKYPPQPLVDSGKFKVLFLNYDKPILYFDQNLTSNWSYNLIVSPYFSETVRKSEIRPVWKCFQYLKVFGFFFEVFLIIINWTKLPYQ